MSADHQNMNRRRFIAGALAGGALASTGASRVFAQSAWRPTKAMKIIVPSTAGGISDILARLLAEQLQSAWGQVCIVDDQPGAGGVKGTMELIKAPNDGHTLLTASPGPQATAYSLFPALPYKDDAFTPVSGFMKMPNALLLHPSVPATTVPELVAYMRANPDKLNYGGPIGSTLHLSGLWFNQLVGTKATHVPYPGSAQAALALMTGQIQIMFDNLTSNLPNIRAGKIRAIAVTTRERSALVPDLPAIRTTMPELAEYDVPTWIGIFMAANAPAGAAAAYNQQMKLMLEKPATIERLAKAGGAPDYQGLSEYNTYINAEVKRWTGIIKRAGLQLELS